MAITGGALEVADQDGALALWGTDPASVSPDVWPLSATDAALLGALPPDDRFTHDAFHLDLDGDADAGVVSLAEHATELDGEFAGTARESGLYVGVYTVVARP